MPDENTLIHEKVINIPDDVNSQLIRPSDWNAPHLFSGGSNLYYLMRDTTKADGAEFDNIWTRFRETDLSKPPYNVDMTGVIEASTIINTAIATLGNGASLSLPPGIVTISATISLLNSYGISLSCTPQTIFKWTGNAIDPMFKLSGCQECNFNMFNVQLGTPLDRVFQLESTGVQLSTRNRFESIFIDGNTGGLALNYGFVMSPTNGNTGNNFLVFESCTVYGHRLAGWVFGHTSSKGNLLNSCRFFGLNVGLYGVVAGASIVAGVPSGTGGSFQAMHCGGGGSTLSDYYITATGQYLITGGFLTGSKRLLICDDTVFNTYTTPVSIVGVNWEDTNINADGHAIIFREAGPLVLVGNSFGLDGSGNNVDVFTFNPATSTDGPGGKYISIGNFYQRVSGTPFAGDGVSLTLSDIYSGSPALNTLDRISIPIRTTGNLPPAGAPNNGRLVLEDVGAGDRNLIIYAGGQRFRIDGGSAF